MSDDEFNTTDQMLFNFGPEHTDAYLSLAKASRGLVAIWTGYIMAPVGSLPEAQFRAATSKMLEGLEAHPDKAIAMIEGLLSIITHMRNGHTYESWFESMGISADGSRPDPDEEGTKNGH